MPPVSELCLKPRGSQTLQDFTGKMLLYNKRSGPIRVERILR